MKEKFFALVDSLLIFVPPLDQKLTPIAAAVGVFFSTWFGGWDQALTTLCIFMGIDYLSGWAVAAIFRKSPKTEGGGLSSGAGFQGLIRKCVIICMVLAAHRLDIMIGSVWIKDCVIMAFAANELLSIVENCGLMGVEIPAPIKKGIEILRSKGEDIPPQSEHDKHNKTDT